MYICTYIHIYTYTILPIHIYLHICIHIYTQMYVCMYVNKYFFSKCVCKLSKPIHFIVVRVIHIHTHS